MYVYIDFHVSCLTTSMHCPCQDTIQKNSSFPLSALQRDINWTTASIAYHLDLQSFGTYTSTQRRTYIYTIQYVYQNDLAVQLRPH